MSSLPVMVVPEATILPPGNITAGEWSSAQTAISRTDPGIIGALGQVLMATGSGPAWQAKEVYDVRDWVSDTTGTTDMRSEMQALLDLLPSESILSLPQGTVINLSGGIETTRKIGIVGSGELRYTDMVGFDPAKGALFLSGSGSFVDGITMTDVGEVVASNGLTVEANDVRVTNMHVDNFGTGIIQTWRNGVWKGFICTGNTVTNVRGGSAAWKEAGGDGIYAIGTDVVIANNIVSCKDGHDARCGIVIQGKGDAPNPLMSYGTEVSATNYIITSNVVSGPFRRAIHTERVSNFVVANNVMYGMSYWGIITWGDKRGLIANNTVKWTDDGTSIAPGPGLADPDDGTPSFTAGIYNDYSTGVKIVGNDIQIHTVTCQYGIFATGHWSDVGRLDVQIHDNTIDCRWNANTPTNGVQVVSLNNDTVSIRNNTFRGGLRRNILIEGLSGKTDNRSFISGNDCVRQSGSYPIVDVTRVNLLVMSDNYLKNGLEGVRATDCAISVVKHNTFMDCTSGAYRSGTGAMYAPNNTFINVTTKHIGTTSTTLYGPA